MSYKIIFTMFLLFSLTSCSSLPEKKLRISATTWVGYTPLFYANAKGWLRQHNIKLLNVSSLAENMYIYKAKNSDAYVGTQYEYNLLHQENRSLRPIMMFDRSYGGDMILSNVSIETLQNTAQEIDTYLEVDSINSTILKDFIKIYSIKEENINYINKDQSQIDLLKVSKKPTIIVTYVPYNITLQKSGFKEIASTKDGLDIFVVDAMFTTAEIFSKHKNQFIELKKIVDISIEALKNDPKEFYETIKPYMLNMDYNEFEASLHDIIWINKDITPGMKERMNQAGLQTRDLI
ncbi:MAG: NitT/TauT family transport system substrate-binding protein [Sulfurimonas sp.]|jgi:NitT/TauT family transport system substrate-binding protein|uniref:ABC transporter substrate-binding protein n=1 Tax=Sulfurimonas sp. TaxID=2022749 RepID=UPI0039E70F66